MLLLHLLKHDALAQLAVKLLELELGVSKLLAVFAGIEDRPRRRLELYQVVL